MPPPPRPDVWIARLPPAWHRGHSARLDDNAPRWRHSVARCRASSRRAGGRECAIAELAALAPGLLGVAEYAALRALASAVRGSGTQASITRNYDENHETDSGIDLCFAARSRARRVWSRQG